MRRAGHTKINWHKTGGLGWSFGVGGKAFCLFLNVSSTNFAEKWCWCLLVKKYHQKTLKPKNIQYFCQYWKSFGNVNYAILFQHCEFIVQLEFPSDTLLATLTCGYRKKPFHHCLAWLCFFHCQARSYISDGQPYHCLLVSKW